MTDGILSGRVQKGQGQPGIFYTAILLHEEVGSLGVCHMVPSPDSSAMYITRNAVLWITIGMAWRRRCFRKHDFERYRRIRGL